MKSHVLSTIIWMVLMVFTISLGMEIDRTETIAPYLCEQSDNYETLTRL
jgi:hypothetical protein